MALLDPLLWRWQGHTIFSNLARDFGLLVSHPTCNNPIYNLTLLSWRGVPPAFDYAGIFQIPQSMYICKQPGIGGEVKPHVDGAFLYTEPQSVVGFWWPLEPCTTSNGCLWAVPGSHKTPVSRVFRRGPPEGPPTEFFPSEPTPFDLAGAVPLEMAAGGLVLLHSGLVHYSEGNASPASRHAYSIHVVEGGPGFVYSERNWLQVPGGPAAFPALY